NIFFSLCVFCSTSSIDFNQSEMDRHLEIWIEHRPVEYSYEMVSFGFQKLHYSIHIKGDKISNVQKLEESSMRFTPTTMEGVFKHILSFKKEQNVHSIEVTYNKELGYPTLYCIRMHENEGEVIDANLCYQVENFKIH
ncbi:MAG: hypothetical protein JJT78_16975, partial [Leptospira sp.]|nr:hypothetical protein [Leptospira sp.]